MDGVHVMLGLKILINHKDRVQLAKEDDMSVKEIFSRRVTILQCKECGRIYKHGSWIELTVEISIELSKRTSGFKIQGEVCKKCLELNSLGVG
jgi:hypothetical protein